MPNVLTNLIPTLYAASDIVSRELSGFILAVTRDSNTERAAVGQAVTLPITPAAAATDITPAVTPPNDGDQTIGNTSIVITKARRVPIRWNGEEQRGVDTGPGVNVILRDQFAQAMRTLVNEIEVDLGLEAKVSLSRAVGSAGTAPFGSSQGLIADVGQILTDNGCPGSDRQLVLNTTAGATLRKLSGLWQVNTGGDGGDLLRRGVLGQLYGFDIRESAGVAQHVKGTAAGATTDATGYGLGATVITLASAGTGTILAGDCLTFAGDSNVYTVVSGDASAANGGTITLAAPGLRQAIPASATNITLVNNHAVNAAFHRSSLVLATRAPALPTTGDSAVDRTILTDPQSGLSFEVATYLQYRQVQFEVSAAWGVKGIKPAHGAKLLG